MNLQIEHFVVAFTSGAFLGAFYFLGLWLTVKRLPSSPQPAMLAFGSFMARTGVVLAGFYFVMDGRWERLLVSLLGFLVVRTACIRVFRPAGKALPAA